MSLLTGGRGGTLTFGHFANGRLGRQRWLCLCQTPGESSVLHRGPMTDPSESEPLRYRLGRRRFMAAIAGGLLSAPLAAAAHEAGTGPWGRPWPPASHLGPGVSYVVIEGNPNSGPHTVHARYPPGHTVGTHRHKSAEHVTVPSGTLLIGGANCGIPRSSKRSGPGKTSWYLRACPISPRPAKKL